ncbi:MAG: helix-turn-helix domain-containing protein [Polyangiaceae bacterium]|nr:helix-turn-helix domain-containing protein [Polyangiaceae bacterium]
MSSPLFLQQRSEVPPAPQSQPQIIDRPSSSFVVHAGEGDTAEKPTVLPATMQRLLVARSRIYEAARAGNRIRTYEVALDLDMSEFHFARQFRLAFDRSPHVYYDEIRAETARAMLLDGMAEGTVARKIGFRRPAELRALLGKRPAGTLPPELARA